VDLADSETARCVYDFPPGADANALVIEKWRQALENSQPLQVRSIDSQGDRTSTRRMFISPFLVTGFKVIHEVGLTAAVA
jgi:hypothetical protein